MQYGKETEKSVITCFFALKTIVSGIYPVPGIKTSILQLLHAHGY